MNWQPRISTFLLTCITITPLANAQFVAEVVSYDQGTTAAPVFNPDPMAPPEFFNNLLAPLGSPERFTGENVFPGNVTPFNPPFLTNEIISVGEAGQITLRLSNFAIPQADGPEIGVFTNAGIGNAIFPDGPQAPPSFDGPFDTFGIDSAEVEVSEDGITWVSLGNITFDIPTNGFNDVAGTIPSDFQQPFTQPLSSFAGLDFDNPTDPDILDLLDGSGGGQWLDISGIGLAQVGFVRFSVADDNDDGTFLNFELDALSIASNAVGAVVPEPTTLTLSALLGFAALFRRRRQENC